MEVRDAFRLQQTVKESFRRKSESEYEGLLTDAQISELTFEQIIEMRKETICPYSYAERIFNRLKSIYKEGYVPKHTAEEYFQLIKDYEIGRFEEEHAQGGGNYVWAIYCVFCVASQHVRGITQEHCLDQIWEIVNDKTRVGYCGVLKTQSEIDEMHEFFKPMQQEFNKIKAEQLFGKAE